MIQLRLLLPVLLITFQLVGCGRPGEPGVGSESSARPPNFVLLFADDLGYGDLGVYGQQRIRTPELDRLAADGLRFTQFYSASPACTASRYALLTGRYPVFSGFGWVLNPDSPRGIHPREQTLAERLRGAGYATAIFGKWHLGSTDQKFLPLQNGFDEYLGLPYSNDMIPPGYPDIALLQGNDTLEVNPDQSALTRRYTEAAVDFIRRNKDQPFFLYLPYAMPHVPLHPGPDFAGRSPRGPYGDVVEEIDRSAGEIRRALEELELAENTLLVFTSDNGPWIIKGTDGGEAGPLRDGKGSTWEGGVREPAIAWWPGTVPAGTVVDTVASTLDLYPTLLGLAGRRPDPAYPADGRDIGPLLQGGDSLPPPRPLFYHGIDHRVQAVRLGKWKLHVYTYSQTGKDYFAGELPLLFDLEADPGETTNLAAQKPEVVGALTGLVERHRARIAAEPAFWEAERLERRDDHMAFGRPVSLRPRASSSFGADSLLTDGLPGDPADLQTWVAVRGRDLTAAVDLGQAVMAERLRVSFLHDPSRRIVLPYEVEFFISADGKDYKSRGKLTAEEPAEDGPVPFVVEMRAQSFRYVRLTARYPGAEGREEEWMMADEIRVE